MFIAAFLLVWGLGLSLKSKEYNRQIAIGNAKARVEIAQSLAEKYRGLSGRESMCAECGMLFVFEKPEIQNFSMRGMQFALDFVFIRGGRVTKIYEDIRPSREGESPAQVSSSAPADAVLELNAGFVRTRGIQNGDTVSLVPDWAYPFDD